MSVITGSGASGSNSADHLPQIIPAQHDRQYQYPTGNPKKKPHVADRSEILSRLVEEVFQCFMVYGSATAGVHLGTVILPELSINSLLSISQLGGPQSDKLLSLSAYTILLLPVVGFGSQHQSGA